MNTKQVCAAISTQNKNPTIKGENSLDLSPSPEGLKSLVGISTLSTPLLTQKSPYVISPAVKKEGNISFGKNYRMVEIQDQGISDDQLKQISHILKKKEEEENFSKLEKRETSNSSLSARSSLECVDDAQPINEI